MFLFGNTLSNDDVGEPRGTFSLEIIRPGDGSKAADLIDEKLGGGKGGYRRTAL